MAATLNQIAAEVGCSGRVVSKVLNGGRSNVGVSAATRDRVLEIASRLGYRSNVAAKAISTGRFNAVGLLMSTTSYLSALSGPMLQGIHEILESQELHLTVTYVDDTRLSSDDALPKVLRHEMVDGFLLNYTHGAPPQMLEIIQRHRIPSIWLNRKQSHNCVYVDDFGAARDATRRLVSLGHRRVTFLDFVARREKAHEVHYSHADRRAGYEQVMRDAGLPVQVVDTPTAGRGAINAADQLLQRSDRSTAYVCYCPEEAAAVSTASLLRGLTLGHDVSVMTFADERTLVGPNVDSYRLPHRGIGRAGASAMLRQLESPFDLLSGHAVPMDFAPGETVGPPAVC